MKKDLTYCHNQDSAFDLTMHPSEEQYPLTQKDDFQFLQFIRKIKCFFLRGNKTKKCDIHHKEDLSKLLTRLGEVK